MFVDVLENTMAFDCFIIDFKNSKSKSNIDKIFAVFPHARVIPFVGSYLQIARSVLKHTTHVDVEFKNRLQ